jgi:hypothetical protein
MGNPQSEIANLMMRATVLLQRLFRRGLDRLVLEAMVGLVSREEYTRG